VQKYIGKKFSFPITINSTYANRLLQTINYLTLVFMQRDCKARENRGGDIL